MGWILFRSLDRAWKEEMRSFTRRVTLVTLSATQVLIWAATAGVARPRLECVVFLGLGEFFFP